MSRKLMIVLDVANVDPTQWTAEDIAEACLTDDTMVLVDLLGFINSDHPDAPDYSLASAAWVAG